MSLEPIVREDGRRPAQLRQQRCERGLLDRAGGSARWSVDRTVVLAAVYGPRRQPPRREDVAAMTVEVIHRSASGQVSCADRAAEMIIRRTVEHVVLRSMYPRLSVSVTLQIVSDDGSALACAINAVCAALVDAGIPMRGIICAATCAAVPGVGLVADPTATEERAATGCVCAVFHSRHREGPEPEEAEVVTCSTTGRMTEEQYFEALALSRDAADNVINFFKASNRRYLMEKMKPLFDFGLVMPGGLNAESMMKMLNVPGKASEEKQPAQDMKEEYEGRAMMPVG